jgi:signal transduction histidine kinase
VQPTGPDSANEAASLSPTRDRFFLFGVVVWIAAILPSFLPILPPDVTFRYADEFSDVAPLLVVLVALFMVLRTPLSGRVRAFWSLLTASILCVLAIRVLYAILPGSARESTGLDLVQDILYMMSYLAVALAIERRPDRVAGAGFRARLRGIEVAGAVVFVFGLLAYFVLIPSVFDPDAYASLVPSLFLYSVLDAYLLLRLNAIRAAGVSPEWRRTFSWLAIAYGTWLFSDLIEGFLYLDILPWFDPGTPLDLIWHLPLLALLVAVRGRAWPVVETSAEPNDEEDGGRERLSRLAPAGTSLAAMAVALPALHFLLGMSGIRNPQTDSPREILLLLVVLALATLLAVHQRLMRQMTTTLEADRRLVADQLHTAQRMEAVGRLASGVAHDFSNILSVIRGRAELLLMTHRVLGDGADDVKEIVEASTRGQSLVTHLLTLGRRKSTDIQSADLTMVVEEMRPLLERVLPESVDVHVSTGGHGVPLVGVDRVHLEQVILNLVINARDAMPNGGSLAITTEVTTVPDHFVVVHGGIRGGEYTVLRVSDTGTGVPPELRPLVFEPFFTTKGEESGTGLGLSIVYGVARQAQGFVRIADAPGGGAVFEVYLPKSTLGVAPTRTARRRGVSRGRETILLVEDYEALRRTAARVLQEAGYRVLEAGSAGEALAVLERRNEHVELLIADLVLPDLSGFELETRALDRLPKLTTVFISGYPEGVTPLRIPENATILEKPFSPEVLTFTVRRALDERKRSIG